MKKVSSFLRCICFFFILFPVMLHGSSQKLNKELQYAASDGDIQEVKKLLAKGADINHQDRYGLTPLAAAARKYNNLAMVKFLVSCGADVNNAPSNLFMALEYGSSEMLEFLLQKGANTKIAAGNKTLLEFCVQNNNITAAKLLKKYGADFQELDKYKDSLLGLANSVEMIDLLVSWGGDVNHKNSYGDSVLERILLQDRSGELVKKLIALGADATYVGRFGNSLLFNSELSPEIAKLLIEKGANVNIKNSHGETALHKIAAGNNIPLLKTLLANGADINAKNRGGKTPIFYVNDINMLQVMIENGARTDVVDLDQNTLLHSAAVTGKYDILKYLISQNAKVTVGNKYGITPLHLASFADIAELLIEAGADVNAKTKRGETPLNYSQGSNIYGEKKLDVARVLIKHNADMKNLKNNKRKDVFQLLFAAASGEELPVRFSEMSKWELKTIIRSGAVEIIQALVKQGLDLKKDNVFLNVASGRYSQSLEDMLKYFQELELDINARNEYGNGMLKICIQNRHFDHRVFKMLLEYGVQTDLKDSGGKTLLHLLGTKNFLPCVHLILSKGADPNARERYQKRTPLFFVRDVEIARALIAAGADVNAVDIRKVSVLHGLRDSEIEIAKLLINNGANVNCTDQNGVTPLHRAVAENYNLAKLLVDSGADVNCATRYNAMPLNRVPDGKKGEKFIDLLMSAGADASLAIFNAVRNNRLHLLKYLVSKNVNMAICVNKNGATPLFVCSNVELAQYLVSQGVYVNAVDKDGSTALKYAGQNCNLPMVKYLISAGAATDEIPQWIDTVSGKNAKEVKQYLKKFIK